MKIDLFKSYFKQTYKSAVAALFLCSTLAYWDRSFTPFIFFFISLSRDYYHYDARLAYRNKLKAKGLTEEDIYNIEFVKKWEETREKGIWKYCITDGAIILGAYLWLIISLIAISTSIVKFKDLVDDPGNMFSFIGYTYMAGAIIGVIINRFMWTTNQHRFTRLTDPTNDKYQQQLFRD
ncbi:hypothetical protein [Mucilaginibacter sp. FT3.2]|uniref:hypothetical protein n=1 Tax=Mucilaginibacter sp. FT3.2 TaxID=2723090 RepID=UPI001617D34A|nr:hypothetical protein [Mucilaginibacter sp. FT3.2]MBB6231848.1 hypothetical protein [Mucilaginibacter sp. FT3.2]